MLGAQSFGVLLECLLEESLAPLERFYPVNVFACSSSFAKDRRKEPDRADLASRLDLAE